MQANDSNTISPVMAPCNKLLFNEAEVRKYWAQTLPETLEADETIRMVVMMIDVNNEDNKKIWTESKQFRCVDDVLHFMNQVQSNNTVQTMGISISTAIFKYTGEYPTIESFRRTRAIAVDIDTNIPGTKKRYPLSQVNDSQKTYAAVYAYVQMMVKFTEAGLEPVKPKMALTSGGGLQYILEFDRELNKTEAQKMFGLLKSAIAGFEWDVNLIDQFSNVRSLIRFDIDKTFSDIAHVQRLAGTINAKYGEYAKELPLFDLDDQEIFTLKMEVLASIHNVGLTDDEIEKAKKGIENIFNAFEHYQKLYVNQIEVNDNLETIKMEAARTGSFIRPSELKSVEYDLLQKIKAGEKTTADIIREQGVRIDKTVGNLTKLYCPFHDEANPSMALYNNELFDVFKDFHDGKTYSLITFWEALFNKTKSEAISEIAEAAGISLAKGERKDFQNLELAEIVDKLLDSIDTENFVYYRLANKNRTCVVRHIDSGEAFIFDGPKMLANHILSNQLNAEDAEQTLVQEFATRFQEKVLIDAFEEFYPGKPTVFQKQFIKFVNLWVPSERYKRVHARVEEIEDTVVDPFSIEEAIQLIKRKTPWTYKYILQLVQNGDLNWFMNWLSGVSKFKPMPTVPVVFGVQGAGKNLFVTTVLDFYLNNEYVKVVSGDRIMQQFNSILESTNLLVLDEGDFSNGKEVDQLKLLTGNDKILIEKKGVDATNKTRHFNIMFFSNGEVPLRHPAMDRRITYFNNEIPLLASCEVWGTTIDDMVERVQSEMVEFWAIIYKMELDHKMAMSNSKNGQFWKQVLMQHPFGALIVKLMNGEWEDIALQLNENVQDASEMSMNIKLLQDIKEQFENDGRVSLTLINRYIHSLNYRMKQSIQKFIQTNHLHEFGINVGIDAEDVKIVVNKKKVQESLKVKNILRAAYPKTGKEEVSVLEAELAQEGADAGVEADYVKEIAQKEQLLEESNNYDSENTKLTPPPPPAFNKDNNN